MNYITKSIHSYNLFEQLIIQSYSRNNPNIIKTRIGKQYRFDIKRKWGYQQNLYYMKSHWGIEYHKRNNPKLHNMIRIE